MSGLRHLPAEFQRGMERHQRIDLFTDTHPVVQRSMQRFAAPHRRFAGILVDIYYDHFLARRWHEFCKVPLPEFVDRFFEGFDYHRAELPAEACARLEQIRRAGWLCVYGEHAGLTDVLQRLGRRFRRPCDLASSMTTFEACYEDFRKDFAEFFPQLRASVGG